MYAVERLGSYITRGVYTVSGPFHPFGGAVDIIVVEQQDGSFKTSPWYVRFGKFQGVLKTKEKVVNICVNGVEADFHMYLDHKGEAYFLKEVEVEEGEPELYQFSSGEDTDGQSNDRRPVKSKSCNYDAREPNSGGQIDVDNVKILARTGSRRARLLGLVFGRKSKREDSFKGEEGGLDMVRASSLERAEIAADLLEVEWSTNLATSRPGKNKASRLSSADLVDCKVDKGLQIDGEQSQLTQTVQEIIENYMDQPELHDGTGFCGREKSRDCEPGFQESECFADETSTQAPFAPNEAFKTSTLGGRNAEEQVEVISALSIDTSKASVGNAEFDEHAKLSDERDILLCHGESDVTDMDRVQPFVCGETPESSRLGLHSFDGQTQETLYLSHGESEGVHVHPEILHQTTEGVHLITSNSVETEVVGVILQETFTKRNADNTDTKALEVPGDHSWRTNSSTSCANEDMEFNEAATVPESYTPTVKNEPKLGSVNEAKNNVTDENDGQGLNISSSESSEEEQFLFSDFDDLKLSAVQCTESISPDIVGKIDLPSLTLVGTEAVNESPGSSSSSDNCVPKNLPNDVEESVEKPRQISIPIDILGPHEIGGKRLGRMVESLPDLWSPVDDLGAHDLLHPCHSLDLDTKSSNWALLRKNASICIKLDMEEQHQLAEGQLTIGDNQTSGELYNVTFNPAVGDPSEAIVASSGSWRMWPFLKRSRTLDAVQPGLNGTRSSDVENAPESTTGIGSDKTELKPKPTKKKVRLITPTSEQLASLNLKEGRNTVTFTFSTAMLGKQQVDCRIYLWKWNTRIVISDVDGTITKSDVLGQFMPWVGVDWSQTGVTHLFSAIKENGYQLLFLSARAISQAYLTRQFLFNLKQDGIALPDGPVVISPDGLFPSLFREVIRRAPHEFKIACLEDIKVLFPSDCSPFYAGFGNRDTDEISYLKVGIPKGKIFIINPKGEVAVSRRVDRKSYPSLHALVHDMFPPKSSTEQEDYNSWNFWKLPPPLAHDC